jgi:peptidoglycan/LPS O-acetylase OafA/YrhL
MLNWPKLTHDQPRLGAMMAPGDNSFGFLRLLMATAVLISHSYLFQYGAKTGEPLTAWTGRSLGEHGVQVFFILSGLMVAQSLDRSRHAVDFAVARVLRIFPALIVCVLLTTFVLGPWVTRYDLADYLTHPDLQGYLLRTLSLSTGAAPLPGVFEDNPLAARVNTSLWTLKYEVICYAGLGLAGALGLFRASWRPVVVPALAVFIIAIFLVSPADHTAYAVTDTIRYFSVFFATGVLAYLVKDWLPVRAIYLVPLFAVFVLSIDTALAEAGSAAFLGYASLWLATRSFGPVRGFCNRYDLSFGIYIYAGPIQQALIERWPDMSPAGVSMLAAVLVVPLAFLSWTMVERPAMALRHRVSDWVMAPAVWAQQVFSKAKQPSAGPRRRLPLRVS